MDEIVERRNDLMGNINDSAPQNNTRSPLITRIDKWEKSTIDNVKQAADRARQQVDQLSNSKRTKITTEFKTFSQELAHLKETENFVEHDLTRLNKMIDNFYQDLQQITQPAMIELHTEESDRIQWNRLIYVEEKSNYTRYQRQQQQPAAGKLTH
jgi:hypothetical protein